jgi:dipeptidyl aminopeptidase/acylaminoacyl peptidase
MLTALLYTALLSLQAPAPAPVATTTTQGWKQPSADVVRMLDAAPTPQLEVAPNGQTVLVVERAAMPPLSELARPWLGLAGMRIDPARHAPQEAGGITGLAVRTLTNAEARRVALPEGATIGGLSWAPNSAQVAVSMVFDDRVELWLLDPATASLQRLAGPLQSCLGAAYTWWSGSERLLVKLVPESMRTAPVLPAVPSGPAVQESTGKKTALRTYQDLLKDVRDERLFEHYATAQLAAVTLDGSVTLLGQPALWTDADPSPDGEWILATRLVKPFSYVLPASLFPQVVEMLRADGSSAYIVREMGLGDDIPPEGVRTGPREHQWQQSADATLWWVEAQDNGDPRKRSPVRDHWKSLPAPFTGQPATRLLLEQRAQGLTWGADGDQVLVREYDRDRRWRRSNIYALQTMGMTLVEDRSVNDRYGDLGDFVVSVDERGARTLRQDGPWFYRRGMGATPEGSRPFLDRVQPIEGLSERLWQCAPGTYESLVSVLPVEGEAVPQIVTVLESPTVTPNYQLRDVMAKTAKALTAYPDPCPELRGVTQELVKYKRADGVELSATLYLPANRKEGERLPLFVWAYPLEFNDAATAGQVSGSPHRFVRVRGPSHLFLLTQGWAVLDNATMPIVGDPETMNDTFLEQIVAASQAAIDFAVERGVADRDRVAVGGHSYGAFMTANLLAHCDLFRAGIARSGAYNRTLTPFGFQSERRNIWEAPQSYLKLSPFLSANKINEPLLLIHGEKDNNMGTFPIQSERMYQAIQGNGGKARLVMLPHESHGYRSREAVLHTLAEMFEWLDTHVKQAAPRRG